MLSSVDENPCSCDGVALPLRVVGVVLVYELFTWELFAGAAVIDALLIRAYIDGANSFSPKRLAF